MPRNLQLYDLIMSKSDLIIETDIPDCLKDLCAHVAAYQALLKKWQDNDFSEHKSLINYPRKTLTEYALQSFKQLKSKQAELIGEVSGRHRLASNLFYIFLRRELATTLRLSKTRGGKSESSSGQHVQ